jgi:aspartyl-tRNA(Asn)/glutamyl-tRNA(Gln) amidotransferase subunit A
VSFPATILEAAAALRNGEVTSVQLTQAALARADDLDPAIGCYLYRCDDAALARAERADKELAAGDDLGPLHGIPLGVKDIVATADGPTTAQSLVLDRAWGEQGDAPVVARLRAAGAVVTGKTSTMEYAIGLPDASKPFPVPRNPWNLDRWAGGSSSGTANGIAAGLFLGGVGTDTGGSIRMPAALCGITGLKPTFGRVPKSGVVPLAWSLDHVGPMARTAHDCALLLEVMAGHDPADPLCLDARGPRSPAGLGPGGPLGGSLDGPLDGVRVAVQRRHHVDAPFVEPSAVARFEDAIAAMAAAGAAVEEVDIPAFDLLNEAVPPLFMPEAFAYHRPTMQARWADYFDTTRVMVASALFYTATDHVQARRVRNHVRAEVDRLLERYDVIAHPTAGAGAPLADGLDFAAALMLPVFTGPWDALGLPAVSVPCGFTDDGMPVGLHLGGRHLDEAGLLRVADAFQQVTDWHLRTPPPIVLVSPPPGRDREIRHENGRRGEG